MKKAFFFLWIMLTMTSVFMPEVYAFSFAQHEKLEIQNQREDDSKEQKTDQQHFQVQIDKTVSSPTYIGFHPGLSFAFELPFIFESNTKKPTTGFVDNSGYFKTLFHFIISPNAP